LLNVLGTLRLAPERWVRRLWPIETGKKGQLPKIDFLGTIVAKPSAWLFSLANLFQPRLGLMIKKDCREHRQTGLADRNLTRRDFRLNLYGCFV
jgi:hypothetical protein